MLTVEEFNVAATYFGITAEGNFIDHSHPSPLRGQNVLSVVKPAGSTTDQRLLASAKTKMTAVRGKRIRPRLDDKVLASWNGLMLGAMARAAVVLNEDKYLAAAEKNLRFIREKLWDAKSQSLSQRWRDGECDRVQLLESHAFMLDGVVQLYEATLEPKHLGFAIELAEAMIAKFYDAVQGGFWQSPAGTDDLILRVKDDYDGAEPSGNSVAALALLKLAAITGREDFRLPVQATLQLLASRLQSQPAALSGMLQAVDLWLNEPLRVVVAGKSDDGEFQKLLRAAHSVYQPNKIILGNTGPVQEFARTLPAQPGAVVYLCTGKACQPPTNEVARLKELLEQTG